MPDLDLSDPQIQAILGIGGLDEQQQRLQQQRQLAQALRNQPMGEHTTGLGGALGALGHILGTAGSYAQEGRIQGQENALRQQRQAALKSYAQLSGAGPDMAPFLGAAEPSREQLNSLSAALRRQRAVGNLGVLTGDPALMKAGQAAIEGAGKSETLTANAENHRLANALKAEREARMAGAGPGALDAATIVKLRPDLTEAMGGEEAVLGMSPPQLANALKALGAKETMDYRKSALTTRTANQQTAMGIMARRNQLREAQIRKSLGEQGAQPEDVGLDGAPVPKIPTKKQREGYDASMAAVDRLMGHPDSPLTKLETLLGKENRFLPGTTAYVQADQARAQLPALINQIEQMAPGMPAEHQKLLEAQVMKLTSPTALINPAAFKAQLAQLRVSLSMVPHLIGKQSGVRVEQPGGKAKMETGIPGAAAASPATPTTAPESPPAGLTPEQFKRLQELRAKKAAGTLQ